MTSSVRLPLATTVCGGSTCKLFRPLAGESSADCRRSAEISREPVQRIGSGDSEGCLGFARSRGGGDFTISGLAVTAQRDCSRSRNSCVCCRLRSSFQKSLIARSPAPQCPSTHYSQPTNSLSQATPRKLACGTRPDTRFLHPQNSFPVYV